jgi:hypothetical protein
VGTKHFGIHNVGRLEPGTSQSIHNVPRRSHSHGTEGALRRAGDVRAQEHVVAGQQRRAHIGWLLFEGIDGGTGEPARLERLDQSGLFDDPTAGGIDQKRLRLHGSESLRID